MKKPFPTNDPMPSVRDKIIGLGERSIRKSYYPQLQQQLADAEKARKKLAESQARYRSLVENINDVIFTLNVEGKVNYISPVIKSLCGLTPEQFIGRPFVEFVNADDQAALVASFERTLGGQSEQQEFRLTNEEGLVRFMHLSSRPLAEEGRVIGLNGIMSDITQRKLAEEELHRFRDELEQRVRERTAELEAANKELEAFAYSVSHDLRAPLRHIDGFLELLQKKAGSVLDDQSRHYMDTISESAQKMGLLINDLLAFSRMGRHAMKFQPVALGPLVRDVIRELEPDAAGREIEWCIGDFPAVRGDAAMLRMVLVNLISNAVKFTRPRQPAQIEIGSQPGPDSETVVFVRDNGVGFDMTYGDKLFGVFRRLHHADEFEGTGIGLAIVRRIINRHGGRTWAEGKVDHGATFYFSLPHTRHGDGDE